MSNAKITGYLQIYLLNLYESIENYKYRILHDFEIMLYYSHSYHHSQTNIA